MPAHAHDRMPRNRDSRPRAPGRSRCLAALVLIAPALATADDDTFERMTRSGFSMDLPAWSVEVDQDNGADGRHVRTDGALRAEVGWTLDGQADVATLDQAIATLEESYGMSRVDRRVNERPGQLRLSSLLDFGSRGWLLLTQVACREAGVLATVTVAAPQRERGQALHDAMLDSFACRDASLPKLVDAWPSSDLPPEFGVLMEGSPVLFHADGRWLMIGKLAPATIAAIAGDAERAQRVFSGYGAAMQTDFEARSPATVMRNLSAEAHAWHLQSAELGTVAASAFTCNQGSIGIITFAGDETGATDPDALQALAARLGCPDLPLPSVLERPGACEAGVAALCGE